MRGRISLSIKKSESVIVLAAAQKTHRWVLFASTSNWAFLFFPVMWLTDDWLWRAAPRLRTAAKEHLEVRAILVFFGSWRQEQSSSTKKRFMSNKPWECAVIFGPIQYSVPQTEIYSCFMKPRPLMWCSVALSGKYVSVKTLCCWVESATSSQSAAWSKRRKKKEQHFWFKAFESKTLKWRKKIQKWEIN